MRLHLELSFDDRPVQCTLDLPSLDVSTLNPTHRIEYVFNQEKFLNLDWMLA